jgi:hypothetical protein
MIAMARFTTLIALFLSLATPSFGEDKIVNLSDEDDNCEGKISFCISSSG